MKKDTDMARYGDMMSHQYPKQYAFAVSDTINILASRSRDQFRKKVSGQEFDKKSKYLGQVVEDQRNTARDVDLMESEFGELERKFGRKTTTQLSTHETGGRIKTLPKKKHLHDVTRDGRAGNSLRKPIRKGVAKSRIATVKTIKPRGVQRSRGFYPRTDRGKSIGLILWAKRTKFKGLLRMKSPKKGKYGDFKVVGKKVKMVRNLETNTRTVKGVHWMEKSYRRPVNQRTDIYRGMMNKQIAYLKTVNRL
jgi:hypothetical protein